MKRKFVAETLIDGDLFHTLDCGHTHVAQQDEETRLPLPEQDCARCHREMSAAAKEPN